MHSVKINTTRMGNTAPQRPRSYTNVAAHDLGAGGQGLQKPVLIKIHRHQLTDYLRTLSTLEAISVCRLQHNPESSKGMPTPHGINQWILQARETPLGKVSLHTECKLQSCLCVRQKIRGCKQSPPLPDAGTVWLLWRDSQTTNSLPLQHALPDASREEFLHGEPSQ